MKFYNSSRESLLCCFMQTSYGWGNIIAQVFSCPMTSLPMCHIDVTHTLDCNGHCIHFTNSHTDISKNNTTVHHHHLHLGILARFWSRSLCTCSIIFTTSAFAHFPSSLCVFLNSSWSSWCCIGFFALSPIGHHCFKCSHNSTKHNRCSRSVHYCAFAVITSAFGAE